MSSNWRPTSRPRPGEVRIVASILTIASLVASAPSPAIGGSRDVVKKALAATVAVEWRADKNAAVAPAIEPQGVLPQSRERELQYVVIDPQTGEPKVEKAIVRQAPSPSTTDLSLASGVLVSADGLVVTLSREQGQGRYTVFLDNGRGLPARLLVDDRRNGLRLLKIEAYELPFLPTAEADIEVGDVVFATFATDHRRRAAAQGIIAASSPGSLQLDLAAGRMSAGGPLVDGEGRLVGILSGKSARSPAEDVFNFAVPLGETRAVLKAWKGEGTVVLHRGMLGVSLHVEKEDGRERIMIRPLPDSPAAAGGVRDGDELVAIDGETMASDSEAIAAVARHVPGEQIVVTVRRDGEEQKLEIVVGPLPEGLQGADKPPVPGSGGPPPAGANLVRPGHYWIQTPDGKLVAIHAGPIPNLEAGPVPNTIRVERSDLEKKLEEVSRNVESLQQEMRKLTEEIKSLRAKSGQQK